MEEKNGPQNYQQNVPVETIGKFFEQNLQQIANTNTTINRFLSAFIDHVSIFYSRFFSGALFIRFAVVER